MSTEGHQRYERGSVTISALWLLSIIAKEQLGKVDRARECMCVCDCMAK